MIKQVLVVRKDLHMRMGKACAQTSHAAMMFITNNLYIIDYDQDKIIYEVVLNQKQVDWLNESFTKVCLYVNSEQELRDIITKVKEAELECHEILDEGATEFHGVPTLTCCAIGPDESEKIDVITGHLKLL